MLFCVGVKGRVSIGDKLYEEGRVIYSSIWSGNEEALSEAKRAKTD